MEDLPKQPSLFSINIEAPAEIARQSRTDRSRLEAQKCISSIPASSEQYSSRRLRRFPPCALAVLCGKKFVSIRVHSWFLKSV